MQKQVYEFISKQTSDPIIERRTCRVSGEEFAIFQSDKEFYEKISPVLGGKRCLIPFPTLSPEERQRRRVARRNISHLYRTTCAFSGKSIISSYAPEKGYTVYDQHIRNSDQRSALDYGQDIDFKRPFFEQFGELYAKVPKSNVEIFFCENCDYANYINDSKNCYLSFGVGFLEDAMYCNWSYYCKDIVDCSFCTKGERGYANHNCHEFSNCQYCHNSNNIQHSYHLFDCHDCSYCFGCVGLQGKTYCIYNKQVDEVTYKKTISSLLSLPIEQIYHKTNVLKQQHVYQSMRLSNTEHVYGSNVNNSSNCFACYCADELEYCKYNRKALYQKYCQDTYCSGYAELLYEIMGGGYYNKVGFTVLSANISDAWYTIRCMGGDHLFGCVGTKNASYAILNKVYTRHEYEKLVVKLIDHMKATGEWGEFFPMSPYGYNESMAIDYFPLLQDQAKEMGATWFSETSQHSSHQGISGIDLQKKYSDVSMAGEEVMREIVICNTTKKAYKILPQELAFYKKNNIGTLPHIHPHERYKQRIEDLPNTLYLRTCDKTGEEMLSVYLQDVPFQVYSEKAYQQEIYG